VPYGVAVAQVTPAAVPLTFEPSLSRTVPVVPVVDGEPASGYRVGRILSTPEQVAIAGPNSHVVGIASATTEPISVAGATGPVTDRVTVGVTNELVRLDPPQSAQVTVEILPVAEDKRLGSVPIEPRGLPHGRSANVEPAHVAITVRGAPARLAPLTTIAGFVDVSGVAPGRYTLPVKTDPVADVQVASIEPATVIVRIR
jgi:YbbR domain-containing protein